MRLLIEPDYAEEFDILVNEITDQYIAGEFQGEELERIEKYFLKSVERRDKLRFTLALNERKKEKSSGEFPKKSPFTSYLAIAASILLMAGAGFGVWWVFFYQNDLNKGLAALRSAFSKERPLEARVTDFSYAPLPNQRGEPAKIDYLQRDLAASLLLKEVSDRPSARSHHALGQYYLAERQFDKAIDQFQAAMAFDPNNAKIHSDLGAALLEEGKIQSSGPDKGKELETFGRSLEHFKKALELDSSLLEAHFNRALVFQYMMPSHQAEAGWREYLQRDGNSPWADEARRNLRLLEENGRRTSRNTGDALKDFLEARRAGDDNAAWKVLSQNYTSAGNDISSRLIDSLLEPETASEATDPGAALPALSYLANLEFKHAGDRYTSDLVRQYVRATAESRLVLAEARKHMNEGYALFTQSRFAEAIREYAKANLSYERTGNVPGRLFAEYRLAHCYVFLPDFKKAQVAFERLAYACESNDYRWLRAHSLYGLAHVSANRSEYSNALDKSARALTAFEQIGDINGVLRCLNQLADVHQSLNSVERSLGYLRRGLALADKNAVEPMQKWQVLVGIAVSLSSMQLHTAALFYQKEALNVALEMARPLIVSRSYGFVGSEYSALQMYDEALSNANQAFETGRTMPEGTGNEIMANASQQLGDILLEAGQCGRALQAYDRSIQLYDALHVEYYSYRAHKGKLRCFLAGSNDGMADDELQRVLGLFKMYRSKITTETQRNSFFDMEQSVYDLAIHYELQWAKDPAKAFDYSEESRARSLLDAMNRVAQVLEKAYGPDVNLPTVVDPTTLEQVRKGMPDRSQILQYAVLDDRVLIWVVTQSDFHLEEVNIRAEQILEKVRAFVTATSRPPASDAARQDELASDLYKILVAPVEHLLDREKFLCVVPDKMLNYLPFGALVSPATARFVMEDYDIGVSPSSTIFVNLSASAKRKAGKFEERLVSVGNPRFSRAAFNSLSDLPSAAREAEAVSMFYPSRRVLLHEEARERTVKSEIEKADVAHLAMHYVVNGASEMLSGFALAAERSTATARRESFDGFLQFHEIYSMKLPRTRLVVLSACQTGIEQQYSGEGAIGVTRPFLVAGVPVVIASLWPVDSDASAELMINFHKYRTRDGLPVTEALRRAQIDMARGPGARYRHPYYWAPFVSVGGYPQF